MKKLFSTLLLASIFSYQAKSAILIGSLSPIVTATTNTPSFITNNAYVSLPQISVSNNGLAITNAYTGSFRWSFDNVTFFTNSSPQFNPSVTNAGTTTIGAQTVILPVYIQMVAITNTANTTQIQIGVSSP